MFVGESFLQMRWRIAVEICDDEIRELCDVWIESG